MRQAERVAGLARGDHRLRRAAGALGVRPGRVEPEPQRDADRVRPGAEERDGAVDAAAHRDGDPPRRGLGAEAPGRARSRARRRRASRRARRPPRAASARRAAARARARRRRRSGRRRRVSRTSANSLAARGVSDDLEHRRPAYRPTSETVARRQCRREARECREAALQGCFARVRNPRLRIPHPAPAR